MTCVYGAVGRPREAQTSSLRVLCLVNCWQTAVQDSVRHFFRLKLEKALAFIWPIFSEPIWLEGAVLHRGWEGEEPKNSVPLGRRGYAPSRKKPGLWKMEGERKTRCWDDRERVRGRAIGRQRKWGESSQFNVSVVPQYSWTGKDKNNTNVRLYCAWPVSLRPLCKISIPPVRTLQCCKTCSLIQDPTNKTARWVPMEKNTC